MTTSQVDRIADQLLEHQVSKLLVTGGEPLLCVELIYRLYERFSNTPVRLGLNSSLIGFTKYVGDTLLGLGVKGIMTSLIADDPGIHDDVTQTQGSWDATVQGIRLARNMGFRITANMVITKWNAHRIEQTGDLAGRLGVQQFGATRACHPATDRADIESDMVSIDTVRESLELLMKLKERWGYTVDVFEHYPWCLLGDIQRFSHIARRKCTAGVTSATIGTDGCLRPCSHAPMSFGSIFDSSLSEAWNSMTAWRKRIAPKVCQSCRFLGPCSGGCLIEAKLMGGQDPYCIGESGVLKPPSQKRRSRVDHNTRFFVPWSTMFREESFGGIAMSGSGAFCLLDSEAYELLIRMKKGGVAESVSDLVDKGYNEYDVCLVFDDLKEKELISDASATNNAN